jgi:DUF4097 and DUF4098 domain-containing protein YvlB
VWNREGYRGSSIGAGSILLLILIVVVGLSAHYSSDVNWGGVRDQLQMDDDIGGIFGGNPYTFDDTVQQQFPAKGSLRIISDRGSLNITPSDDNTLRVVVHKKLRADNQQTADKYNEGTKPQITVTGNSVLLNANTNGAGEHGVESDLDVFVPRDATLDVASKRGDVTINDRKADVKVTLQHGDIALDSISGSARLTLDKGSIRASKITGDVDIDGHIDDVTLEEVGGAAHLNGDFFNDIRLNKIAKTVTFKSARSDVMLSSVPGDLEISGDSLRATDVAGPSRLITKSKEIHLENISGDLQVETSNGGIEIHAADKLPVGKMSLSSKNGDLTVELPANAGFQIDAIASKGDISSDFGSVKIDSNNGESHATGTVGNGVAKLQFRTDHGDIRITKG